MKCTATTSHSNVLPCVDLLLSVSMVPTVTMDRRLAITSAEDVLPAANVLDSPPRAPFLSLSRLQEDRSCE